MRFCKLPARNSNGKPGNLTLFRGFNQTPSKNVLTPQHLPMEQLRTCYTDLEALDSIPRDSRNIIQKTTDEQDHDLKPCDTV